MSEPFDLSKLSKLFIKPPMGPVEAMLREVVAPPDPRHFNCNPCPLGHDHTFQLNTGQAVACSMATWILECGAGADGCPTQRGVDLPWPLAKELLMLAGDYRARNDAVTQVLQGLRDTEEGLIALYALDQQYGTPALPKLAANKMVKDVARIRQYVGEMDWRVLPDDPVIFQPNDAQSKGKGKQIEPNAIPWRAGSEEYFAQDDDFNEEALDPQEHELHLWYPDPTDEVAWHGKSGVIVHVIIYREARKPPFHALCWALTATHFDLGAYEFIRELGAKLLVFSVLNSAYEAARSPVDLAGRGRFMIYRDPSMSYCDCPRLGIWEERARESARAEVSLSAASLDLPSQPVASSSKIPGSLSVNSIPVASSSKTQLGPSAIAATTFKRKADNDGNPAAKRARAFSPGRTCDNPLILGSSEGDIDLMGADSDVEVVDENFAVASSDEFWSD
ncbi:hypothetical protein FB451DRAFT_1193981 [Mycena latifolia]|nr:hypothetical protein FB451DRAFT_1193981 [Mycena latifolia]